jgi:hypothetical protein
MPVNSTVYVKVRCWIAYGRTVLRTRRRGATARTPGSAPLARWKAIAGETASRSAWVPGSAIIPIWAGRTPSSVT